MKRFIATVLVILSLLGCVGLSACDSSSTNANENDSIVYEEKFLGKWSNEDALFSFQHKDGVYCGGGVSNELRTVVFDKYTATKSTITIYIEDGSVETFDYKFSDGCLYLDDMKLEKFN